jgi:hypothetical protein
LVNGEINLKPSFSKSLSVSSENACMCDMLPVAGCFAIDTEADARGKADGNDEEGRGMDATGSAHEEDGKEDAEEKDAAFGNDEASAAAAEIEAGRRGTFSSPQSPLAIEFVR